MYKTVLAEINQKIENYLGHFENSDNKKNLGENMLIESKTIAIQEINKRLDNLKNYQ